jgi:hypothetical protein
MRRKKFDKNPPHYIYNFMCAQTALNVIFVALIIVLVLGLISTNDRMLVVIEGTDKALDASITLVEGSSMLSRDIMDLRVQANILEAMQQRIIISSPELRKQYDRMFSEVEAEILGKLEEDLDKTKKGMEKLDKGIKELIPKNKGLRLDLDRSGEYPI